MQTIEETLFANRKTKEKNAPRKKCPFKRLFALSMGPYFLTPSSLVLAGCVDSCHANEHALATSCEYYFA
jgi:hypothetical protein